MSLIVSLVTVLITVIVVLMAFYTYYSWKTGVPTVSTSRNVIDVMIAQLPAGPQNIVEMGSGLGALAIETAKARPDCQIVGIEYSILPLIYSKMRLCLQPSLKNIRFMREDFFKYSLKDTGVVMCFLLSPMLLRLKPKFLSELPDSAMIISNHYEIPEWDAAETIKLENFFEHAVRVYKKAGAR